MIEAERTSLRDHGFTLRDYLRSETNRGRSDVSLAREYQVSRHTIRNWKRLLGLVRITRTELSERTIIGQ